MFTRYLALCAILHGALYGASSVLEYLVHLTDLQEVVGEHHHRHETSQPAESASPSPDEAWINCVFCLDGVVSTDIELAGLTDVAAAREVTSTDLPSFYLPRPALGFHARSPPEVFLNC